MQTSNHDKDSNAKQGIFQLAYELINSNNIAPYDRTSLANLLVWFEDNLITPDKKNVEPTAIFWFKSDAVLLIQQMWEFTKILSDYNILIEIKRTSKPGYIVYEDKQQVAAVPFRDTF
jgi:hypothetical protein